MANTSYTYSVASDTLNGQVDSDRLTIEIRDAPIVIALDYVDVAGDVLKIWFKASLDAAEQVVLTSVVGAHTGEPLPSPVSADGIPYAALYGKGNHVQVVGRDDAVDYIRATHNFCDACTWFGDSARLTAQLSDDGDGLTFNSGVSDWIDLTHGRQHSEEAWIAQQIADNPGDPHGYAVIVTVDGVEQEQRAPFAASGGDYTVDYTTGVVTFASAPASLPHATFSHATTADFIIQPAPGKTIEVQEASAHLSLDFVWNDTITMALEALVEGVWTPVGENIYKTLSQFVDESTLMDPPTPIIGGARGLVSPIYTLPIPYAAVRKLNASQSTRLRIYLKSSIKFGGTRVTATLKSVSYDES